MSQKYDVIVIGAGLGGLSGATMLAKNGLKVLLLERHNVPGGYATSFVRGRYEFEVALHELSNIGPKDLRGGLYRYLEYLGVAHKVEFLIVPHLYRSIFPGLDVTLPAGHEAFEEKLCKLFPHESKGIHRFLERVFGLGRDFARVVKERGVGNPLSMPFRFPDFFRYLPTIWGQVLNRDVQDPLARAVISQYWGYVGLPPSKICFLYLATTLAAYVRRGPAFPIGRSQALSNAFMNTFEELGGEVRMNCGAQKIITENGRVSGVITDEEEEIRADWIVSNADPVTACRDLIGFDNVPPRFFTKLQSSEVAASTVNVYMGVDRSPEEFGLMEHEVFINADHDFDRHYEGTKNLEPPEAIAVTCYNAVYPGISPKGTCIVVLTALKYGEPWYGIPPEQYVDTKNRIADAMITMAEKVFPGLREYTEVVEVSTPLTNMRYAGAMGGSIYGFNQPPRDNMVWRRSRNTGRTNRMSLEQINWLLDVREYRRVAKNRKALREPGQGTDYTHERFREVVQRVVSRIHPRRMNLRVVAIIPQTATAKTFCFERVDGPLPPFRAGQYVNVMVNIEGVRTSRPYSISSAPMAERLELTVRDKPGGFVAPYLLKELKVGDVLETTGPAGHFCYEPLIDGEQLVFLAGGSGVTPFMSMIRDTVQRQRPLRIKLLYGSRTPEDVIFTGEIEKLAASHFNFTFSLVISEPPEGYGGLKGFLDSNVITQLVGDIKGKTFYVCGPRAMNDFCRATLKEMEVPRRKIRYELYGAPDDVSKEPGWPEGLSKDMVFEVEVDGKKMILAKAGEPLLNALERSGFVVPALCRSGECSSCRIRLLEGKIFMPSQATVRESDRKAGYIHSCVSYPIDNLKVRI